MTKIFYSGLHRQEAWEAGLSVGLRRCLVSYFHGKDVRDVLHARLEKDPDHEFLVDSGAFGFQREQGAGMALADYERFIERYLTWLEKNKDCNIAAAVELDVDNQVGSDQVLLWQEKFFAHAPVPIIYVWHPERGEGAWDRMCAQHEYVGFSSEVRKNASLFAQMMATGKDFRAKIHGFAITDIPAIESGGFCSVDSTTWQIPLNFGELPYWDGEEIRRIRLQNKDSSGTLRAHLESRGVSWYKVMQREWTELSKVGLLAWTEMEADLVKRYSGPEYWRWRIPLPCPIGEVPKWAKHFEKGVPWKHGWPVLVEILAKMQRGLGLDGYPREVLQAVVNRIGVELPEGPILDTPPDVRKRVNDSLMPVVSLPQDRVVLDLSGLPEGRESYFHPTDEVESEDEVSWEDEEEGTE